MKQVITSLGFCLYIFTVAEAALLDAFVVEEIKDYEKCERFSHHPTVNITREEDYESITICWRFMTTAYPHCGGSASHPIGIIRDWNGDMCYQMLYGPISGMSEDGKHAGFMGFQFNNNGGTGWQQGQVPWHAILYNEPLNIYQWQSFCISFSKKTQKQLFFHNGIKYLDFKPASEITMITKYFLDELKIANNFRGSFSDLQVYSQPMDESDLEKWTTCQYDEPGDVYEWDINRFNLTHNERIISSIEKVESKSFYIRLLIMLACGQA